ncbi:KAT8 regulatory NSL complex subunit 3-like [Uloborus diversus]|uniref:KAT8 regulatory NSL complex subunit 3-like n=1 Tax=Uloborus diversus TaxID=327109 RepID=UPI002409D562|nr:KAT8 regulatory NSL complex subunit 3-like [Uloborus diversus]
MSFESKLSQVEQYLRKLSGQEKEVNLVDHNYPKSWNSYPDSQRIKPARMLFMKEIPRNTNFLDNRYYQDVDVVSCEEATPSPFDSQKIRYSANECEDLLKSLPFFSDKENKKSVDIDSLSDKQLQLYTDVMDVLNALSLSRLVHLNSPNEFVKRKIMVDQAAAQMRQIFSEVFWEKDLVTWLHQTVLNDIDFYLVLSYVNILQKMMQDIPSLVEKLVQSHARTKDILLAIIRKQWDPVFPIMNQHKLKKLPRNPAFVMCPSGPIATNGQSSRMQFWNNCFNSLGKIVNVPVFPSNEDTDVSVEQCLDHIILSLRSKVSELKNHYPEKPLILVGWTIGSLIACHVSLLEQVDAVICLGFPLTGVNGSRGDLTDPLLDNQAPTLFVVGQNANMCSTDDIEDFRSRMQAESGLIVVGGADDFLRMNSMKMMLENITQAMVDYCISEEVSDFLLSVFAKLPQTSAPQPMSKICSPIKEERSRSTEVQEGEKRKRRKPREYSPEIFPARKKTKISQTVSRRHSTSGAHMKIVGSDSESSSSEPTVTPKNYRAPKAGKKKHEKNTGRSGSSTWRRRTTSKSKTSSKTEDHSGKSCPSRTGVFRSCSKSQEIFQDIFTIFQANFFKEE